MFAREMRTQLDRLQPAVRAEDAALTNNIPPTQSRVKKFDVNERVMVRDYKKGKAKWCPAIVIAAKGSYMYKCKVDFGVWTRHIDQ